MTITAEQVYKEAVTLSPIDRAELIEKLFRSFLMPVDKKIEAAWKTEIAERRAAYDAGEISSDTMENVFDRLAKK